MIACAYANMHIRRRRAGNCNDYLKCLSGSHAIFRDLGDTLEIVSFLPDAERYP